MGAMETIRTTNNPKADRVFPLIVLSSFVQYGRLRPPESFTRTADSQSINRLAGKTW
jgi:hypothetical protein